MFPKKSTLRVLMRKIAVGNRTKMADFQAYDKFQKLQMLPAAMINAAKVMA